MTKRYLCRTCSKRVVRVNDLYFICPTCYWKHRRDVKLSFDDPRDLNQCQTNHDEIIDPQDQYQIEFEMDPCIQILLAGFLQISPPHRHCHRRHHQHRHHSVEKLVPPDHENEEVPVFKPKHVDLVSESKQEPEPKLEFDVSHTDQVNFDRPDTPCPVLNEINRKHVHATDDNDEVSRKTEQNHQQQFAQDDEQPGCSHWYSPKSSATHCERSSKTEFSNRGQTQGQNQDLASNSSNPNTNTISSSSSSSGSSTPSIDSSKNSRVRRPSRRQKVSLWVPSLSLGRNIEFAGSKLYRVIDSRVSVLWENMNRLYFGPFPFKIVIFSQLENIRVTEEQANSGMLCPICAVVLPESQNAIRLECGHIFHGVCIMISLRRRKLCPVCVMDFIKIAVEMRQRQFRDPDSRFWCKQNNNSSGDEDGQSNFGSGSSSSTSASALASTSASSRYAKE